MDNIQYDDVNWAELLSVTNIEVKKYKNAEKLHEIAQALSSMGAWLKDAKKEKVELTKEIESLAAKRNEIVNSINMAKETHTGIMSQVDKLNTEVAEIKQVIDTNASEYRDSVEGESRRMYTESIAGLETAKEDHVTAMDKMAAEIKAKEEVLESVKTGIKNMRTNIDHVTKDC